MTEGSALVCQECGATPEARGDQVSEAAVAYLCSRCLMGRGPVGRGKRAARGAAGSAQKPRGPRAQAGSRVRTRDPEPGHAEPRAPGPSRVRTRAERRQQWQARQIEAVGGLEAWRRQERERRQAQRQGRRRGPEEGRGIEEAGRL